MTTKIHEEGEGGAAPGGACSTSSVGNTPGTDTGWGVNPPKKKIARRKVSMKEFLEINSSQVTESDATHIMTHDVMHRSGILARGTVLQKVHGSKKLYRVLAGRHAETIKSIDPEHVKPITEQELEEAYVASPGSPKSGSIEDAIAYHKAKHADGMKSYKSHIKSGDQRSANHAYDVADAHKKKAEYLTKQKSRGNYSAHLKEHELEEAIKGWKHAHSDIMKARADASAASNSVVLHQLRADGKESGMHDARKSFRTDDEARAHVENIKKLNPTRKYRYNKYVNGQHVGIVESEETEMNDVHAGTLEEAVEGFAIRRPNGALAKGSNGTLWWTKEEHAKQANIANHAGEGSIEKVKLKRTGYGHNGHIVVESISSFFNIKSFDDVLCEGRKLTHIRVRPNSNTHPDHLGKIVESELHRAVSSGMKDLLHSGDHATFKKVAAHLGHPEWQTNPSESDLKSCSASKLQSAHDHMYKGHPLGESVDMISEVEGEMVAESKTTSDDAFDKLKAAGAKNIKTTSVAIHYNHPKTGESMKLRHRDEEDGVRRVKTGELNDHLDMLKEDLDQITEAANEYGFLSKSGFKSKGSLGDGGKVHSHPLHGDVIINKHGHWHHVPHGSTREDGFEGTTGDSLKTHLSRLRESEQISEVEVQGADRYEYTHGKKPKGYGNWYFSKHKSIDFSKHKESEDHIVVRGTYGDAKKQAVKWANEKGHAVVHVQT